MHPVHGGRRHQMQEWNSRDLGLLLQVELAQALEISRGDPTIRAQNIPRIAEQQLQRLHACGAQRLLPPALTHRHAGPDQVLLL